MSDENEPRLQYHTLPSCLQDHSKSPVPKLLLDQYLVTRAEPGFGDLHVSLHAMNSTYLLLALLQQ